VLILLGHIRGSLIQSRDAAHLRGRRWNGVIASVFILLQSSGHAMMTSALYAY